MVMVGAREVATPELDKMEAAREPQPGTLSRFLDWLRDQQIVMVQVDGNGNEAAATRKVLHALAEEAIEGDDELAGSQALGEVLEVWGEYGYTACYDYGERCPWPKLTEYDELWRKWRVVTLPAGYYACSWSTERLLARFYGIDIDKAWKEKDAILGAIRAA